MEARLLQRFLALVEYNDSDLQAIVKNDKMNVESGAGSIHDGNFPLNTGDFEGASGVRAANLGDGDLGDRSVALE